MDEKLKKYISRIHRNKHLIETDYRHKLSIEEKKYLDNFNYEFIDYEVSPYGKEKWEIGHDNSKRSCPLNRERIGYEDLDCNNPKHEETDIINRIDRKRSLERGDK